MKKILIIGLKKGSNLGDVIISDCTIFLVEAILKEMNIDDYRLNWIDMADEDYSLVNQSDLIIFAGGGLIKYRYQMVYSYLNEILSIADQDNIPVIFNSVGVEGYDETDEKCMLLKKSINYNCIKQITVRDDVELLRDKYIYNKNIYIEKAADSAVWSSMVYQTQKDHDAKKIGLGVIREGIFKSNGIDLGLEELLTLWSEIIVVLEDKKIEWEIFTTGWPSDMKFAKNLMVYLGKEDEIESKIVSLPTTAQEVLHTISDYKGIIAGRLHANIVAYSLKIPSVGLVWNEKCAFWGEAIGYSKRYFRHNHFNGEKIVDMLIKAIEEGYHEDEREKYMQTTYLSLKRYLEKFFANRI